MSDDLVREAQTTQRSMRRIRWIGVPFALLQFTVYTPPEGVRVPFDQVAVGVGVAAAIALLNTLSYLASNVTDERALRRLGRFELAVDAALVVGVTFVFAFDSQSALWALLVIPVIEGGVRFQLRGALITWAGTGAAYVVRDLWAASRYDAIAFSPDSISYRLGIILIVALAAGVLARNLRQQVAGHREARRESDRRAELLRIVAASGRSMMSTDAETVLDRVVDSCLEIGFEGAEICIFDQASRTYEITHPRGLPTAYTRERQPDHLGIAGLARRSERTVVIDDYATWPRGVPDVQAVGFRAVVASPVWTDGRLSAVLVAGTRVARHITPHEVEAMELLATQTGGALANAKRFEERRAFEERLMYQAFHEPLTRLANRALFLDRLEHCLARKSRDGTAVAVLFLDLDRFKRINDSLGHERGDDLLAEVARRLESSIRPGDTVARFGGDEFAILIEDPPDERMPFLLAERILEMLQHRYTLDGHEVYITASIGVAYGAEDGHRSRDFLREADLAMYKAKEGGGARCEVFTEEMSRRAARRLESEVDLRRAIDEHELELLYQPMASMEDGRLVGVEALVRWNHPERGLLTPPEFIPLAEETGLIIDLGRWVLATACAQTAAWRKTYGAPSFVTVNISANEFRHVGFAEGLRGTLENTGLSATHLVLEVTETVLMRDELSMLALADHLRALGVRLAVDDFGLGYSSLSYLKIFPFSILKIDKSFISSITERPDDRAIVRSVIGLAHELGIRVVAEGAGAARLPPGHRLRDRAGIPGLEASAGGRTRPPAGRRGHDTGSCRWGKHLPRSLLVSAD